jgi:sucrose phosphorylase
MADNLQSQLLEIYDETSTVIIIEELKKLRSRSKSHSSPSPISQNDAMLICYADSIVSKKHSCPLQSLREFLIEHSVSSFLPQTHLLPFFEWDTDRGFSVKNFYEVDERNGTWADIEDLVKITEPMFDFVANHASIDNPLVQGALISRHLPQNHPLYTEVSKYQDFVIAYSMEQAPDSKDIELLARPRANPVLTPYAVIQDSTESVRACLGRGGLDFTDDSSKILGQGLVWTTFSRGQDHSGKESTRQVDLNFKNPHVFLEALRILEFYNSKGARFVRLDAIGYLWKKLGSSSIHESETHHLIYCLQQAIEYINLDIVTVAEVNEAQKNVIPYLGSKEKPEADLVYQFTHFPLAIHAITYNTAGHYSDWLRSLESLGGKQFLTVLGSHDGLGMKPLRGVLPEDEIQKLASHLVDHHCGLPNYAFLPGGEKIIYEVCATPWVLVNGVTNNEPEEIQIARFCTVAKMGLIARGLPGFYINGILAADNYLPKEGLDENRSVNREQFELSVLSEMLSSKTYHKSVFQDIKHCLSVRSSESAFNPLGPPVLPIDVDNKSVLVVVIPAEDTSQTIVSINNLLGESQQITLENSNLPIVTENLVDVLGFQPKMKKSKLGLDLELEPFQTLWLKSA